MGKRKINEWELCIAFKIFYKSQFLQESHWFSKSTNQFERDNERLDQNAEKLLYKTEIAFDSAISFLVA